MKVKNLFTKKKTIFDKTWSMCVNYPKCPAKKNLNSDEIHTGHNKYCYNVQKKANPNKPVKKRKAFKKGQIGTTMKNERTKQAKPISSNPEITNNIKTRTQMSYIDQLIVERRFGDLNSYLSCDGKCGGLICCPFFENETIHCDNVTCKARFHPICMSTRYPRETTKPVYYVCIMCSKLYLANYRDSKYTFTGVDRDSYLELTKNSPSIEIFHLGEFPSDLHDKIDDYYNNC